MNNYESITSFFYKDHRVNYYGYEKNALGIEVWIYKNKDYAREIYLTFRKPKAVSLHTPLDQQIYRDLLIYF